jgi:type VI secretion system Hcp family effector
MAVIIHMQVAKKSDPKTFFVGFTSQKGNDSFEKKMIELSYFEQTVSIPFESGNNVQGTANRTHSPVTVRKRVDESSPTLRQCMRETTSLNIEFFFHRPAGIAQGDYAFYSVALTEAKVASIKTYSPDAFLEKSAEVLVPIEEVQFTFDGMNTFWYVESSKAVATSSADSHSNALTIT